MNDDNETEVNSVCPGFGEVSLWMVCVLLCSHGPLQSAWGFRQNLFRLSGKQTRSVTHVSWCYNQVWM